MTGPFGDPPEPSLEYLRLQDLPWQKERPDLQWNDVARYRPENCVKVKDGTVDLNIPGRPPRPRSAVILKAEIANLNNPPRASQPHVPEAVYLVHCDSTDTTYASASPCLLRVSLA